MYLKITLIFLLTKILLRPALAQEKPDLQKLMPRRLIDKVEFFVGPNITLPNGRDQVAGVYPYINPNIQSNYFTDWGYRFGLGAIHTFSKGYELELQISYSKRAYINKWFVYNPNTNFESQFSYGIKYFFASLRLSIPIERKKRVLFYSGLSAGKIDYILFQNKNYTNGNLTASYQRRVNQPDSIHMSPYSFDVVVGFRYNLAITEGKLLSFSVQYDYALNDLINVKHPYLNVRTSTISTTVSLIIFHPYKTKTKNL